MSQGFHLHRIDSLRGIAIILVLGFHADYLWNTPFHVVRDTDGFLVFSGMSEVLQWLNPLRRGWAGVELFLLISGFLIHLIFLRSRETFRYRDFFRRRFWRIYPPYLVVLITLFIIRGGTAEDISLHLLMIHNLYDPTHFTINGSFWSIALEVQLYVLYPLLLFVLSKTDMRKVFSAAILLSISLTITETLVPSLSSTFWYGTFVFKLWYVWIGGAFVAEMFHSGRPVFKKPLLAAILGYILFTLSDINYVSEHITTMLATFSGLALMDYVLHKKTESPAKANAIIDRIMSFTGMISYSLYLVHQPIMEYFRKSGPDVIYLICSLAISFLLAFACYHLLEKPSIAIGKKLIRRYNN